MTSDVATLRKALECIAHYNVTTAGLRIQGDMRVYGYTDCAAVYVSFPADTEEWDIVGRASTEWVAQHAKKETEAKPKKQAAGGKAKFQF